jgi:hypothetical protein
MTVFKQFMRALITLLVLSALLAFLGFPLLRSSQVWSQATVLTKGACRAFGAPAGELCAYTGEVSETFAGTREIRSGHDVVQVERDSVVAMTRSFDAKNLNEWQTNIYGAIVLSILFAIVLFASFKNPFTRLLGRRAKSKRYI